MPINYSSVFTNTPEIITPESKTYTERDKINPLDIPTIEEYIEYLSKGVVKS